MRRGWIMRSCKLVITILISAATLIAVVAIGLSPRRAASLPLYALDRAAMRDLPYRVLGADAVRAPLQARRLHAARRRLDGTALRSHAAADLYPHRGRAAGRRGAAFRSEQQLRHARGELLYWRQDHRQSRRVHPGDLRRCFPPLRL